ncbi:MAG: hypothetical protein ABSG65_20255 [Bryobacteraceae bacterium]
MELPVSGEPMGRCLIVLCGWFSLFRPIYGATSTIYAMTTSPLIATTSTTTFQPVSELPTAPSAGYFAISPDGTTAYFSPGSACAGFCSTISAMSLSTGKTLHTYQTAYIMTGGTVILPKASQLYVASCEYGSGGCAFGFVEIFDIESEQELAVISTGGDVVTGLSVASNVATVYASHQLAYQCTPASCDTPLQTVSIPSDAVTAIDVATLMPTNSLSTPQYTAPASALVFGYDRVTGYLLIGSEDCSGCPSVPGAVVSVDLATLTFGPKIPVPDGFEVNNLAIAGNGATLALAGSLN